MGGHRARHNEGRPWQEPAAWALVGGGVGAVVSILFGADAVVAAIVGLASLVGGGLTLAVLRMGPRSRGVTTTPPAPTTRPPSSGLAPIPGPALDAAPWPSPDAAPGLAGGGGPSPTPVPEPASDVRAEPDPEPASDVRAEPDPEPAPDGDPEPAPDGESVLVLGGESVPTPDPRTASDPEPTPDVRTEPAPEPTPAPESDARAEPESDARAEPEPAAPVTLPVFLRAEPAPLRDLDPASLGMPPSATAQRVVGQAVPPYIRRDIDDALDRALRPDALVATGGVVVVRGAPVAGSSRTLWEALRRAAGHRTVLAVPPPGPAGEPSVTEPLPALADGVASLDLGDQGPVIVWVDDADQHLERGLTLPVLDRLVSQLPGCIVALTVSTARLRLPDLVPEPVERWLRAASDPHELAPELTDDELGRAFARFPDQSLNPRLRWLPSWFGAADQLRDRYREARETDPNLAAVVTAAATWYRAGLGGPVPRAAIHALLAVRVGTTPGTRDGAPWPPPLADIDAAITRATEEVAPERALLTTVEAPSGPSYRIAATLIDEVALLAGAVPASAWEVVLDQVGPAQALVVGRAALGAERPETVEQAWTQVVDHAEGDGAEHGRLRAAALLGLGLVAEQRGNREAAEDAYRRAVATDHPDHAPMAAFHLGGVLEEGDRIGEAEAAYHDAIAARHPDATPMAAFNLGWLYEQRRRADEAITAYERAVDSGHPEAGPMAAYNLAWLLEQQRRRKEAEELYRRAIASGHPDIGPMAAVSLGILLERLQRGREARKLFERVVTGDHEEAAAAAKVRLRGRSRR